MNRGFRVEHRGFQLRQRIAAEQGGDKKAVGSKGAPCLAERADKVVRSVQRHQADHKIERIRRKRQSFFFKNDSRTTGAEARFTDIGMDDLRDPANAVKLLTEAGPADQKTPFECPGDSAEPIDNVRHGAPVQEIVAVETVSTSMATHSPEFLVKDFRRCGRHAGGSSCSGLSAQMGASFRQTLISSGGEAGQYLNMRMATYSGKSIRRFGRRALDLILPPVCPVSSVSVAEPGTLDVAIWRQMNFIAAPFCDRCGAPYSHDVGDGALCAGCIADPPDFERARAAVVYDEASHKLLSSFKYSDRTDLAPLLGKGMAQSGRDLLGVKVLVAPVPLHWRRLLGRRYNQAAMLAKVIARLSGSEFAPMLFQRIRATQPQVRLSAEARRRNLAGAIAVKADLAAGLAGRRVVVVDDVYTTGATLSACARAARKAGAAGVDALVAARTMRGTEILG